MHSTLLYSISYVLLHLKSTSTPVTWSGALSYPYSALISVSVHHQSLPNLGLIGPTHYSSPARLDPCAAGTRRRRPRLGTGYTPVPAGSSTCTAHSYIALEPIYTGSHPMHPQSSIYMCKPISLASLPTNIRRLGPLGIRSVPRVPYIRYSYSY